MNKKNNNGVKALQAGDVLEGVVTALTAFGAFVKLPDGQTGLVHISEVADTFVKNIADHIQVNDVVKVKVLQMNKKTGRLDLSIKRASEVQANTQDNAAFEERLAKFLKESQERISDLKKSQEHKRREGRRGKGG